MRNWLFREARNFAKRPVSFAKLRNLFRIEFRKTRSKTSFAGNPNFYPKTVKILYRAISMLRYCCTIPGIISVAEPHHFYAAPAPGKNFYAAPEAPALAPTQLYSKAKFFQTNLSSWWNDDTWWNYLFRLILYDLILPKIWTEWVMNLYTLSHFSIPNHV
jgi:hypothetical protein